MNKQQTGIQTLYTKANKSLLFYFYTDITYILSTRSMYETVYLHYNVREYHGLETVKQSSSNETIELDWENWHALLILYRPLRPVLDT